MVIEDIDVLVERARALASAGERRILGIAGPPGGGKSTVARAVVAELGERARLVAPGVPAGDGGADRGAIPCAALAAAGRPRGKLPAAVGVHPAAARRD